MLDLSLDHLGLITRPEEIDDSIVDKTSIQRGIQRIVHDIGTGEYFLTSASVKLTVLRIPTIVISGMLVTKGQSGRADPGSQDRCRCVNDHTTASWLHH